MRKRLAISLPAIEHLVIDFRARRRKRRPLFLRLCGFARVGSDDVVEARKRYGRAVRSVLDIEGAQRLEPVV